MSAHHDEFAQTACDFPVTTYDSAQRELVIASDYCVVIPALNAAKFLSASLSSVTRQSVQPSEIIVIDDGSDDETAIVARGAGVRVISRPETLGPSASRNLGVAETRAPLIAFLDADDEWMPDHASRLLDLFLSDDVAFAGSDAVRFGSTKGVSRTLQSEVSPLDLRDILIRDNPVIQSTVMVRRDAFEMVGGYDESLRLSEDYDLWTRLSEQGLYAHVGQPTVRRRMHADQVTQRFLAELVRAWWGVRRRFLARRLAEATPAGREHLLGLLDAAGQADVDWAIWTGDAAMLAIVREELQATDENLQLVDRLSSVSGLASPSRRLSQDVRCAGRSLVQMVRGDR